MNSIAKCLVPNKEWLVKDNGIKVGSISKNKKGYNFLCNGKQVPLDPSEIKNQFGNSFFEEGLKTLKTKKVDADSYTIYDYPCSNKPFDPVYNVKKRLPLYSKSDKSKSQYCAGYYVIKFRKGWVKSFCPKLITLERYPFHGPFKTESEMKTILNTVNKQ
jgi:hypothetical protein